MSIRIPEEEKQKEDGMNRKITFNTPLKGLTLERGRATAMEPDAKGFTMLWYVRAKADAEDGFDVVLAPEDADKSSCCGV